MDFILQFEPTSWDPSLSLNPALPTKGVDTEFSLHASSTFAVSLGVLIYLAWGMIFEMQMELWD